MEVLFADKPSKGLTFGELTPGDIYRLAEDDGAGGEGAYLCFYDGRHGENRGINLSMNSANRIETYSHGDGEKVVLLEQVKPLVLADMGPKGASE